MDDRRPTLAPAEPSPPADPSPSAALLVPLRRCAACLAVASTVWALSGCSLFVMAGKMFFGDPEKTAAFRAVTDVDLAKGDKSVLIVATTPESAKQAYSSVDVDIVERVGRELRRKGVKVYPSKKVLDWVDRRGGQWGSPDEIAAEFDADYVIEIDVDRLSHREPHSPELYRGQAVGNVRAYEVVESGGGRVASPVFSREFTCTYPSHHPKQAHQISERTFQEEFLGRVCTHVAQLFYDHRASETVH
ncbi:MAG TPA: hypothetical protein VF170_10395 [Planctomycetaceae bacterium]